MIQDQLRETLDAIRVKLQAELDSQIAALGEQQAQAVDDARTAAEQEAERTWTARLASAQDEWASRLQSELAAASAEADRRMQAETARLQADADQLAASIRAEVDNERKRREDVEADFLQWRDRADVAEQRRVAEAAERQRRETEREQHYRRELAELLGERQRREAALEEERQEREQHEASLRAEREQREAAFKAEREALEAEWQKQEAAFKEERAGREAVFSEERREHETRESEARQRLEALQAEIQSRDVKEAELRQRVTELDAEVQRRTAMEEEHHRTRTDLQKTLTAVQESLAAERSRAAGLDAERTKLGEEIVAVKVSLEKVQQLEAQRVRELEDQLRTQRQSFESGLETERKRTADLTDALGRAQVSLAAERQSMAAAQKALATERLALASEHEAVARARDALAAEREAAARTAPLLGRDVPPTVAVTEARAEERQSQLAVLERLLNSTGAITLARSLSEALAALLAGAGAAAPRAALFVINANSLQGWKSIGFHEGFTLPASLTVEGSGVLGQAVNSRQLVSATSATSPSFASLPADRAGVAVPILVGGRPVAVLYADDATSTESQAPSSWPEEVQILGQHASVCLAHLTAVRSAQAARIERANANAAATFVPDAPAGAPTEDSGARRYAKLLVSEIKLYNESAVRLGREKRDLMNRLRPEIDRARKLYEERVSPSVAGRGSYFQQELVQTLADGDPALLGSSA
jgi:hypothetical protein